MLSLCFMASLFFNQFIFREIRDSACRKQPADRWYGCDLCPELRLLRKCEAADQSLKLWYAKWKKLTCKSWEEVKVNMKDIQVVLSCCMLYLGAWRFNPCPFGFDLICPYIIPWFLRNLATLVDKILQLGTWKNVSATTRTFPLKACTAICFLCGA